MMILKLDEAPPADLLHKLRQAEGILNVATVSLPPLATTQAWLSCWQ
jgi:hypothetical protein